MNRVPLIVNIIITALVLFVPCSIFAQNDSSLLWKIEGNGIQPAYLYGTIHILPQSKFEMPAHVETAFGEADVIVMELDMDNPNMQSEMMQNAAMKDGITLDQLVSESDYKKISKLLKEKNIPIDAVKGMKPFMISAIFLNDLIEGTTASFEVTFMDMAQEAGKEINGLETTTEQMQIFDDISYESQANDLLEMINDTEKMKKIYSNLMNLYLKEDVNGLYAMMEEYFDNPEELELMLTNRNKKWILKMKEFSSEKTIFYAVGAGHLGGPEGVLQLLKDNKYTLTPVTE